MKQSHALPCQHQGLTGLSASRDKEASFALSQQAAGLLGTPERTRSLGQSCHVVVRLYT